MHGNAVAMIERYMDMMLLQVRGVWTCCCNVRGKCRDAVVLSEKCMIMLWL